MAEPRPPCSSSQRRAAPFNRRSTRSASEPDPSDDSDGDEAVGLRIKLHEQAKELQKKSNHVLGLKRNLVNLTAVAKADRLALEAAKAQLAKGGGILQVAEPEREPEITPSDSSTAANVSIDVHEKVLGQLTQVQEENEQLKHQMTKLLSAQADLKQHVDFSSTRATKLLADNRALELQLAANSPMLLLQQVQVQYELMIQQKAALEGQLDTEGSAWREKLRVADARESECRKQLGTLRQAHSSVQDEITRMERQATQQHHEMGHLETAIVERDQELRLLHEQVL
jgi:hypothetical protein